MKKLREKKHVKLSCMEECEDLDDYNDTGFCGNYPCKKYSLINNRIQKHARKMSGIMNHLRHFLGKGKINYNLL